MVAKIARPLPMRPPTVMPTGLGGMVRAYRIRAGLSQNRLAHLAGVDPAYINRIEHADRAGRRRSLPSREVILQIWEAFAGHLVAGPDEREVLLVAAGHCPQAILDAGGWTAYLDRMRRVVLDGLTRTAEDLDRALAGPEATPHG
jgi:DNA-binding XRE family transcriptional regulator